MSVDNLVGAEESKAKQLEERRAQLLQCIKSGQIGFVSTVIYTIGGPKSLQPADFGNISEHVIGVLKDCRRGFEEKEKYYLVVRLCKNVPFVAKNMADFLYHKLDSKDEKVWPGSWIPFVIPFPIPALAGEDERKKLKKLLPSQIFRLLKKDPTRFTPLLFSERI